MEELSRKARRQIRRFAWKSYRVQKLVSDDLGDVMEAVVDDVKLAYVDGTLLEVRADEPAEARIPWEQVFASLELLIDRVCPPEETA